jgi:hypothetical protein
MLKKSWFAGPFDPETFWQKVSIGLVLVMLVLVVMCQRLRTERSGLETQVKELSSLNATQRKTIRQIGQELSQVRSSMSDMIGRMDQLLSDSKEQKEMVAALPEKVVETADKTLIHSAENNVSAPAITVNTITRTLNADLNRDGIVDWKDFEIFSQYWNADGQVPADLDKDNHVSWQDFQIFTSQWLMTETWYQGPKNG